MNESAMRIERWRLPLQQEFILRDLRNRHRRDDPDPDPDPVPDDPVPDDERQLDGDDIRSDEAPPAKVFIEGDWLPVAQAHLWAALGTLNRALEGLGCVDVAALPDDVVAAAVNDTQRAAARLDAATSGILGEWLARDLWTAGGARSPTSALANAAQLSTTLARKAISRANTYPHAPAVADAAAAGEISTAHVDVLGAANTPSRRGAFSRDEEALVERARTLRWKPFCAAVTAWSDAVDGDHGDTRARRQRARAHVRVDEQPDHTFTISGALDPVWGAEITTELSRLERQLWAEDAAEARQRLDRNDVRSTDLRRSRIQRHAEALLRMARRSAATLPDARPPDPLVTIVVGLETAKTMLCETHHGAPLSPAQFRDVLTEAQVDAIVYDGNERAIRVNHRERFFTGALRRVIEVRDRHCQHPSGCDTPAHHCHVDHITPYHQGGETTEDNGRLLCGPHNRTRHRAPDAQLRQGPPDDGGAQPQPDQRPDGAAPPDAARPASGVESPRDDLAPPGPAGPGERDDPSP